MTQVRAERGPVVAEREPRAGHLHERVHPGRGGEVVGVRASVLAPDDADRGRPTNRTVLQDKEIRAQAVIITTGGIGGDHDLVRAAWPERLGTPPRHMVTGVPAHVDGRGIGIAQAAGGRLIHPDRMWHYTEGVHNWDPIWPGHGIRILPGPSSLWLDATGRRLPVPLYPGFDTMGTLAHLQLVDWTALIATVPAGVGSPRVGEHVAVAVDVAEAHLFDEGGQAYHAVEALP